MIVCKKCGSQLPDNVAVCPVCNTPTGSAAASGGENQPAVYMREHEFMEDTFVGDLRARAKAKPGSTFLLIILGGVVLFLAVVLFCALMELTSGRLFPLLWIAAGLWQIIHAKAKWRKKRSKYTVPITAAIVNYTTVSTRTTRYRFSRYYYAIYEYEYNGMLVQGMSDDNYGSVPESGTRAQILIRPDRPDRLYEPELEKGRIHSDRMWGVFFTLLGVALAAIFFSVK